MNWRPVQEEAIVQYIKRRDVLAVLPTGYGKSLIFQLIPRICSYLHDKKFKYPSEAILIVICPLISLITSHLNELSVVGISACLRLIVMKSCTWSSTDCRSLAEFTDISLNLCRSASDLSNFSSFRLHFEQMIEETQCSLITRAWSKQTNRFSQDFRNANLHTQHQSEIRGSLHQRPLLSLLLPNPPSSLLLPRPLEPRVETL